MRVPGKPWLVALTVGLFLVASPAASSADSAATPVVTGVVYSDTTGANYDVVSADFTGVPIESRIVGDLMSATTSGTWLGQTNYYLSNATPRTRHSYHAGACSGFCANATTITWGPWNHPFVPTTVTAAPPTLTATSPTKTSPGIKITINKGAHANAPVFAIYRNGYIIAKVGPDSSQYVDSEFDRPQNTYQVQACYADCDYPDRVFDDGFVRATPLSPAVVAWAANAPTCRNLGQALWKLHLPSWRGACKP